MQLAARARIGALDSEELNERRGELNDLNSAGLVAEAATFGVALEQVQLRDLTFPKNIQDLFARHLEAKIRAKADLENARTAVATSRALKNASELMKGDDNIRFFQFLETITKIAAKGTAYVHGGRLSAPAEIGVSPSVRNASNSANAGPETNRPMNIWKHCLLSQHKFGGAPDDFLPVHRFLDSSKLHCYHPRHRLLLHHTTGIEWATELLGDVLTTRDHRQVLVRDVAAAHCQEDLSGRVPTLAEWLAEAPPALLAALPCRSPAQLPAGLPAPLRQLVLRPYLRSGNPAALLLTTSTFGLYLAEQLLGLAAAETLAQLLPPLPPVADLLAHIALRHPWQYRPDPKALAWLQTQEPQAATAPEKL